jgi:hypothetical protein
VTQLETCDVVDGLAVPDEEETHCWRCGRGSVSATTYPVNRKE